MSIRKEFHGDLKFVIRDKEKKMNFVTRERVKNVSMLKWKFR